MKRKYFSVMLMAAMTVASTSMVTSCKDYDDDINALRTEITNNATTLTSLVNEKVNNLTNELTTLKSQQDALDAAYKSADEKLQKAIETAKTDANAYADVQAAAAQKAAIEAAKASLDDAVKTINAAIEAANKNINDLSSRVTTNEEQIAGLLDADKKLEAAIIEAKAEAKAAADKALDAANAAQKTADENAKELALVSEKLSKVENDLDSRVSILEKTVKENSENIAQNAADIKAKFNEAHELIVENQKTIVELKDADADLLSKINKNITDIQALQSDLATLKTALNTELRAAINTIEANYNALEARVTENETAAAKAQEDATQALADAAYNLTLIQNIQKELNKDNADSEVWKAINENANSLTTEVIKLNNAISNLKSELTGKINEKADQVTVDKLTTEFNKLQTEVGQNTTDIANLITNLNKYFGTTDFTKETESINDQIQDLQRKIAEIKDPDGTYTQSLQTQIDKLKKSLDNYTSKTDFDDLKTKFEQLTANYSGTLADLNKTVTDNNTAITKKVADLESKLGMLAGFAKQLKSLVFGPTEYYQGIEAIAVESFNYIAIKDLPAYNAEDDQVKANTEYSTASTETTTAPDAVATYYLNPSNANVDTDVKNFKFRVQNAAYTRAALGESDLNIKNVEAADGKIKVHFTVKNAKNIAVIPTTGDGKVDVAALQYSYKSEANADTTVTSDWAALKKYNVTDFVINKAKAAGETEKDNELHLAQTAREAINSYENGNNTFPTFEIVYDDENGINLDKWINVHYKKNGGTDQRWGGQATVNEKGFKLVYSLVGYKSGENTTNESAHADIKGNILTVNGYKNETGRQIIGRTPLVRVTLVDENTNNQVAAVGYIIVKITDKEVKPVEVKANPIKDNYTVACEGDILDDAQAISWDEIENKVCAELDITKTEFETNWTFDNTNQYVKNNNGKFEVATTNFGSVKKTTSDDPSHKTNVLKWTVDNATAYDYFVTKGNETKSIWVKFTPTSTLASQAPIYVELTWTPDAIYKTPQATIKNSSEHKKEAAWHKANTNSKGWDQLHIQVGNATQPGATCEYQNLVIANTFNKSVLEIVQDDIKATYPKLANAASVSFVFAPKNEQTHTSYTGVSGHTYIVTVKEDGSEIYADGTLLATITAADGTVNVEKNDVTKDILNKYADIKDIANALTFTVKANVETCEPAKNLIKLNNNKFDVKVIKPLFVSNATIDDMQLNNFSSLTKTVTFEFTDFNNYTQEKFYENSKNRVKFFDFYKISAIKQVGTIRTNYSGAKKPIDTNDIKVTFTQSNLKDMSYYTSGVVQNMGTVKLEQVNQSRANGFTVWVPVEITYNWGTLKTEIVLNVQAADAATAKRH